MTTSGEPENPPWWNAGDDAFAGATPLFPSDAESDDAAPSDAGAAPGSSTGRAQSERRTSTSPWGASGGGTGTPIAEGLRLAAAVSAWSNETGLTDTLRSLAAEAVEMAATMSSPAAATDEASTAASDDAATEEADDAASETSWETHQSVCAYCPLCRGMAAMRAVQPQVSQGMAESMASLTTALNSALESLAAHNKPD